MRILATDNYGMRFNVPRQTNHEIIFRRFVPWRKLWRPMDALASWIPTGGRYDLVHSFNRIPLTSKPWIVTFESKLPRTLGGGEQLRNVLRARLLEPSCRRVIAMSAYARRQFVEQNQHWNCLEQALAKVEIIHPSVPTPAARNPKKLPLSGRLKLLFVGNDFARKGGIVSLRLARMALQRKINLEVHIISKLRYGNTSYCDHVNSKYYESDLKLLSSLENVFFHGEQPNKTVLEQFGKTHLNLLPTIDDTYGYSVLEGYAAGAPALTTDVCALPEFVIPGANGIRLRLAQQAGGRWEHIHEQRRDTRRFWDVLDSTYDNLASQALTQIEALLDSPGAYERLSHGALQWIRDHHDPKLVGGQLDRLYETSI
jgi:glycosyltransferase involved in cell wall biosynthesis